jgi:hypothetical protein
MEATVFLPRAMYLKTQMQNSAKSITDPVPAWSHRRLLTVKSRRGEVPLCKDELTWGDPAGGKEIKINDYPCSPPSCPLGG